MNLTINGKSLAVQGIRALRPGITVEQAIQKTKNNGLDEVFFNANGRTYVAYGDSLQISDLARNKIPAVKFNTLQADVIAYDDEANSVWEGARKGAVDEVKNGINYVRTAVGNLITTVQPAVAVAGGVGIAGLGIYQLWRSSQGAVGASLASGGIRAAAGAGGVGWIGDALKGSVIGGLKVAAVSAGVGLAVLSGYGALKGALEAKQVSKDLGSIAAITEDGTAPANGGEALSWNQLYPAGGHANRNGDRASTPSEQVQPIPGYGNPVYGVPSYSQPIFFQQPVLNQSVSSSLGLMNPQQLRAQAGR